MTEPDALRNRSLIRDAMDMIGEIAPVPADLRERRLADWHPELPPEERRQVLRYCERFETAAWMCAKQVREGGIRLQAGAACLAEQVPELDILQVNQGLSRAMRAESR